MSINAWHLVYQEVSVLVETDCEVANHVLQSHLNASAYNHKVESQNVEGNEFDAQVRLLKHGNEWRLSDDAAGIDRRLLSQGDALYHLTDRIVFYVADKSASAHCLHAAAVADNGKVIAIPASSGSGKSSLTCWLVAQGLGYITDELILLDSQSNIQGVARPIQIKHHGVAAIKPLLRSKQSPIYAGGFANSVPIESLGGQLSARTDNQLALFVFPTYRADAGFSFTQLSSAQAGMALMSNHVNARNIDGHGFRDVMQLIRQTPCYALEYGGFDALPNDFLNQLKKLLHNG